MEGRDLRNRAYLSYKGPVFALTLLSLSCVVGMPLSMYDVCVSIGALSCTCPWVATVRVFVYIHLFFI